MRDEATRVVRCPLQKTRTKKMLARGPRVECAEKLCLSCPAAGRQPRTTHHPKVSGMSTNEIGNRTHAGQCSLRCLDFMNTCGNRAPCIRTQNRLYYKTTHGKEDPPQKTKRAKKKSATNHTQIQGNATPSKMWKIGACGQTAANCCGAVIPEARSPIAPLLPENASTLWADVYGGKDAGTPTGVVGPRGFFLFH